MTSIIVTLFTIFGITMYREFSRMEKNDYQYNPNEKKYGRDALFELAIKLFEENEIVVRTSKKENKYRPTHKNVADMETDGVYFQEELRN